MAVQVLRFPSAVNSDTTVPVNLIVSVSKRDIAAIGNNQAEYHLVFGVSNSTQPVVIRFVKNGKTERNTSYTNFMTTYGASVLGS